jgi:uncharacterized protein (TIGR02231 family)
METSRCKLRIANYELRIIVALVIQLCSVVLFAQTEQTANSTITNVTVFRDQAQITRIAKVSLPPGNTNLVFNNLSPYINLNSLQVKTEGNITLLSVSQRNNFLKADEKPKAVIELEDTLNSVNQLMELNRIKREALLLEKDVIASNKHIGGANSGTKVEDLEDALTLIRKRSVEIGEDLLKLTNQEKKLRTLRDKLQNQLAQLTGGDNNVEIVVSVKTLANVSNSKIEISYLTGNASWQPFYDIRVKDTKSPLQLVSKANITQYTGEDWKNVILKLSTSNPNEWGIKPELQPNYVSFMQAYYNLTPNTFSYSTTGKEMKREIKADEEVSDGDQPVSIDPEVLSVQAPSPPIQFSAGNANALQTDVNIEFNVTSAYSIPTDNNPHQVDLTINNLDAVYGYTAIPKLDKDAFVTAKVSGNDLVNQISGEANIYFDGTFVGKTFINGTTSDSIVISLGRDKRIQIQRIKLKDFCSKTFSGSSKKELTTYEISMRNTRKEPLILTVEDQIPVSTDKEIEIKMLNASNAVYNQTTGKLVWTIRLEAEQSQSIKFSYEIKYPKDKQLSEY